MNEITKNKMADFIIESVRRAAPDNPFQTGVICSLGFFASNGFFIGTSRADVYDRQKRKDRRMPIEWKDRINWPSNDSYKVDYYLLYNEQCYKINFGEFDNLFVIKVEHVTNIIPLETYSQPLTKFIPIRNFVYVRFENHSLKWALHFHNVMLECYFKWITAAARNVAPPMEPNKDEFLA